MTAALRFLRPDATLVTAVAAIAALLAALTVLGDGSVATAVVAAVIAYPLGAVFRYSAGFEPPADSRWRLLGAGAVALMWLTDGVLHGAGAVLLAGWGLQEIGRTAVGVTRRARHERALTERTHP